MSFTNRTITDNIPGAYTLEYVYKEDVDSIDDDVTLKSGKAWDTIPATRGTIQPSTKQKDSDGGAIFETSVKFKIPKDESGYTDTLKTLSARNLILRETDKNGTVRIIGTLDFPARLQFEISKSSYNGYDCEITQTDIAPPIYI